MFGPYYKPEILAEPSHRSPFPLQPEAAGSEVGFHMVRRQYLSDELMRMYHVCFTLRSA